MAQPTRSIFVTFQFVGFHRWPTAPDEVGYLRDRHRHLFKCRVDIGVGTDDRQIEYHMLKRSLDYMIHGWSLAGSQELELGSASCEAVADATLKYIRNEYPSQDYYRVEVSEDGENGSIVTLVP